MDQGTCGLWPSSKPGFAESLWSIRLSSPFDAENERSPPGKELKHDEHLRPGVDDES